MTDLTTNPGGVIASLPEELSTRDRILNAALDLFIDKGYDATTLREIADQLGFTKAALYYHFSSKDDILLALHMRLHAIGKDALERLAKENVTLELWESLLDQLLDEMLAQKRILLLHERNQAAFEKLHEKHHEAEHEDLQERLRAILADTSLPLKNRVRMACSFGAIFASLFMTSSAFEQSTTQELAREIRSAIHDLLGKHEE